MGIENKSDFRGFDENEIKQCLRFSSLYRSTIELYELCLNDYIRDPFNKRLSMNSVSLKRIITDDSGYISQNVESNSSVDTSLEHRPITVSVPHAAIKEVFLNEDALLEKPNNSQTDPSECSEFEHLYFMSDVPHNCTTVPSSVTSQKTTFSGFNDSEASDVSEPIPIATPIVISSEMLGPHSDNHFHIKSLLLNSDKENDCNYANIKNNLNHTNMDKERQLNSVDETETYLNSIQNRMMTANSDMSLFESFYSFVCNLYTKNEAIAEDTTTNFINPSELHIKQKQMLGSSPYQNSYWELETMKKQVSENINALKTINKVNNRSSPAKPEMNRTTTPMSPDLFSDDEITESLAQNTSELQTSTDKSFNVDDDRELLTRTRDSLGGVPPPPSITVSLLGLSEILDRVKDNQHLFITKDNLDNTKKTDTCLDSIGNFENLNGPTQSNSQCKRKSLLLNCEEAYARTYTWPGILQARYHGLHYNRSQISEEFEHLCVKYAERYIGAETQSSCTIFGVNAGSPTKRKIKYCRAVKSPGKRLSHLARRRITFSKDSLQPSIGSSIGSRTRQIMVDAKKFELLSRRKSPKKKSPRKTPGKSPRKTPGKSPKKKSNTPRSSGKKKYAVEFNAHAIGENLNVLSSLSKPSSTKRALFQSPQNKEAHCSSVLSLFNSDSSNSSCSQHSNRSSRRALFGSPKRNSPSKMTISSLYPARRKMTPKRALFKSPNKQSSSITSEICDKKRKRTEVDDEHPTKFPKSLSTCTQDLDSSNESKPDTSTKSNTSGSSQDITQHRKKKLMWTVAEALRSQSIDLKHPQFKVYASVLARIIRYFLPNLFINGPRSEGSTTESMLRIARQYVFAVTRGKTVDQIIREAHKHKSRIRRPTGYIGLDQMNDTMNPFPVRNKENILQDRVNIMGDHSSDIKPVNKIRRSENVERIRRVINFGDDGDVSNSGVR